MKLSAEQFAELAASFNGQASTTRHERRRAARLELQTQVKVTPHLAGAHKAPIYVAVCDFSARGISFLYPAAMTVGQQFVTELPRKTGGFVELLCTALHSRLVSKSLFRIGAEFTCTVSGGWRPDGGDNQEMNRISRSMLA